MVKRTKFIFPFDQGDRVKVVGTHLKSYGLIGTVKRCFKTHSLRMLVCSIKLDDPEKMKMKSKFIYNRKGLIVLCCNLMKI